MKDKKIIELVILRKEQYDSLKKTILALKIQLQQIPTRVKLK